LTITSKNPKRLNFGSFIGGGEIPGVGAMTPCGEKFDSPRMLKTRNSTIEDKPGCRLFGTQIQRKSKWGALSIAL